MTFWGSSEGSCRLGRPGSPGPEACPGEGDGEGEGVRAGDGVGDGDGAARTTGAATTSSRPAAAPAMSTVRSRVMSLPNEAGGQVDDRLRQEAEDHTDDRPDHQRLAALLPADGPLRQVEARAEDEGQDADREQDALDPAGHPVERGADLL